MKADGVSFDDKGTSARSKPRATDPTAGSVNRPAVRALHQTTCIVLTMVMVACGGDGPTAPDELAARYTLIQHGGRTLPVAVGTEVKRPPGESEGPGVTCTRDLLATDLHFWSNGSVREVGWQDSTRITCPDGSPVQFRRFIVPGHITHFGETFNFRLYYGLLEPLLYGVVHVRRSGDTLTVFRREEWRNNVRVGVDVTLQIFVPMS